LKIVLTGGGTGGHIYPALAIARYMLDQDPHVEILYIGSSTGLEQEIVTKRNIPFKSIKISGFKRKLSFDNVKTIWRFLRGVRTSKNMMRDFQPDVVIGTGGYVCGPVVYAAAKLGIPTIVHEQNVIPGLTNIFLSKYVDCLAVSFAGSEGQFSNARRTLYTGNPRATEVSQANPDNGRAHFNLSADKKIVLVVGGSRGARAINEAMVGMVPQLSTLSDVHFIYVTGQQYFAATNRQIEAIGTEPANLSVVPYLDNMPEVLAATSLIVNRSGASFLAEITALGVPSILIPSPNVTNNHQEKNARWLADEGASVMIREHELDSAQLFHTIRKIMTDPIRTESMAHRAKKLGCPQSAQKMVDEIDRLLTCKQAE